MRSTKYTTIDFVKHTQEHAQPTQVTSQRGLVLFTVLVLASVSQLSQAYIECLRHPSKRRVVTR